MANIIDLDYYGWRFPSRDIAGGKRLLVPHGDPDEYEYAMDFVYNTSEEARVHLEELEYDEEAVRDGWVLVHFSGEVIGTFDKNIPTLRRDPRIVSEMARLGWDDATAELELDELVHEFASLPASEINNQGLDAQIQFVGVDAVLGFMAEA